jgi:hypothetical protein
MRITRNQFHLMVATATLFFTGCAAAANMACPLASDIKQSGSSEEGTNFTAVAGGNTWKGEVSKYDDDVDLKTLHFEEAIIANAKKFVACDYFGAGMSNLRMTIDTTKPFAPTSQPAWVGKDGEQTVCKGDAPSKCEFNGS